MDPPDLRHLYEEGTRCTVCQGGFYGNERVSFFPECSVPHYLHHQCLTRSFLILGVEKTYRCPQCLQQRSSVSTVNMPSDLPHRSTMGDSPPEDHPPPPPSPPPPPPLPSPPPKFAPGTSILDAGEFIPQTSNFLEEPKSEVVAPDGSLPNDVSARYCNHCGVFLNSSAWSRFYDHVFCHRCSLQLTFYDTNVSFLEEGAEGEEGDEEEDGDEEMTIVDANEGASGDEEMTILDANERAYGDEELMADLDADEEEEDGADSEDDGETAAGEEEKEDDADTEDDEEMAAGEEEDEDDDDDTSGENG